jgi:HEAT repeat protein
VAAGHTQDDRLRPLIIAAAGSASEDVRYSVAFALGLLDLDDGAAAALRALSADPDSDVRDWATFDLAESELSDPETIDALLARVDDSDDDTRAEAIYGLARRQHPRAREFIDQELERTGASTLLSRAEAELVDGGAR